MKHANLSVFVPHAGCRHACSFCNQKEITGKNRLPAPEDLHAAVQTALKSNKGGAEKAEIAFFGGSFTAMDREYILSLLKAAKPYIIEKKEFEGIRISTRPDAIDEEILLLLKQHGVTSIELGAQSMRDEVLSANRRGHTAKQVADAAELVKGHGFSLTLQMMTGLYRDDNEGALYTARELVKMRPDSVRIYPAVLLKGTYLEKLYLKGIYKPQVLEDAVELCAALLTLFYNENIPVIRLGLHTVNPDSYTGGPFHPALRELCEGLLYYKEAIRLLEDKRVPKGTAVLAVHPRELSKMIGHGRINIEKLLKKGYNCKIRTDHTLKKFEVQVLDI